MCWRGAEVTKYWITSRLTAHLYFDTRNVVHSCNTSRDFWDISEGLQAYVVAPIIMQAKHFSSKFGKFLGEHNTFLWRCDPTRVMASSFTRFSRSHTTTHHSRWDSSGRVISSSQRPLPDNTRHLQQTNIHAPGGIRTHSLSRRAAADLRLRPRSHWDRLGKHMASQNRSTWEATTQTSSQPAGLQNKFL